MARPIRVLELRSVRGTGGGPEKTILLGAALADPRRFAVTVCYIRDQRDEIFGIDGRAASHGVDYVEVRERHSLDFGAWSQLLMLARERQIDLVHSHEYKTDAIAWWLSRRSNVRPLATVHGWTGQSPRERWLYYPADKRLLARFPRLVAVSSDIKRELVMHGADETRITMLLNGIDPMMFRRDPARREAVRRQLGWQPEDVCVGTIGRLERQKRIDLLLESTVPLLASRPYLRIAIVGDGSLRSELTSVAHRLGLGDRCQFLGHREDVADVCQSLDLFVQASEYEGTPNAVLEAMALETPVVATDVGGTRELATGGVHATIVPPHDVPALTNAIDDVITNRTAAMERAAAARRRVESDLSFETRTRRLEAIYEELMSGRESVAPQTVARHA